MGFLGILADRTGTTALVEDLRHGRVGWPVRTGLSAAAAAAAAAVVLLAMGVAEMLGDRITDAMFGGAVGVGGVIWVVCMLALWSGFRTGQRILRTAILVIGIGLVTVSTCVVVEEMTKAHLLTGGVAVSGIAAAIAVIATASYRSPGGREMVLRSGDLRVACPECGYSLVGLSACECPECGYHGTIDEVIWAQDYAAPDPVRKRLPAPAGTVAADRPLAGPPPDGVVPSTPG